MGPVMMPIRSSGSPISSRYFSMLTLWSTVRFPALPMAASRVEVVAWPKLVCSCRNRPEERMMGRKNPAFTAAEPGNFFFSSSATKKLKTIITGTL